YKIDVLKLIVTRIEPTCALVVSSVVLSVLIALPMAAIAARNAGRAPDHAVRIVSTFGITCRQKTMPSGMPRARAA
ncbi:hypothetical protein ACC693_39680, partial [Rhizobium ruizarguesonis]